jgi:signal transduction histidine kinase
MDLNFELSHSSIGRLAGGVGATPLAGLAALDWFRDPTRHPSNQELNLRLQERQNERERIARDLHDTLFQGIVGASMVLFRAVEDTSADSPSKPTLERALFLMRRAIDEGRHALRGLRSSAVPGGGLEQALAGLPEELAAEGPQFRISVTGRPKTFHPVIEEEIYLITREAVVNALRHSAATSIETDVEYLPGAVRVRVRDNGLGIDQEILRTGRASHWGLQGMRERAANIGARLRIWSRKGAGTEVELSVPTNIAIRGPLEENVEPLGAPNEESAVS